MSVAVRLGFFAAGLVVVFAVTFGVGKAIGPDDGGPATTTVTTEMPTGHDMGMGS